jgi:hypothetical protein
MSEPQTSDNEASSEESPAMYEPSKELLADLDQVRRRALWIAIAGGVACIAGAALNPTAFLRSYLIGIVSWISIAVGCLALVMLQHVVRSGWGVVIRRTLEAGSRTIPAMALLFIPLLIGLPRLYPWADPAHVDPAIHHKAAYLNVPFFIARTVFYFAAWSGLSIALHRMSTRQDRTGDPRLQDKMRMTSALGLLAYCLTMTFASIDWLMSLTPHWYSTIYGVYIIGGQAVAAMSFAVLAATFLARREPMASALKPRHFHDFGKLLLAFVMLWAYFAVSQLIVVWSGNLPEEIPWYLDRMGGGFRWVSLALIALHFALPFTLLLSRDLKRRPGRLAGVAGLLLAARLLDLYWLVIPTASPGRVTLYFTDIAAPIALGGVFVWLLAGELKRRPLLPVREPLLKEALQDG